MGHHQVSQILGEYPDGVRVSCRAIDLGFHSIGLCHLVLLRGLDAAWASDRLLVGLPGNYRAAANRVELRELLTQCGFARRGVVWYRRFGCGKRDQQVFCVIRRLATLDIGRVRYQELFGSTGYLTDRCVKRVAAVAAG